MEQSSDSEVRQSQIPVLAVAAATNLAAELELPPIASNLFQRLIRNPHSDSTKAKERECSEMLCALMQNAPILRQRLLTWMSAQVNGSSIDDDLDFSFKTEQAIGAKRDDLRIVAWRTRDERPILTWTVEIKVGASFHQSSRQLGDNLEGQDDEEQLPVMQLLNYDHWLMEQDADHRAGFVLALSDRTDDLPGSLKCSWACLTWTTLGEMIADALRAGDLSQTEQFIAKHTLGFIRSHLWRAAEMSESKLEFNDVSLIRAFAILAKDCDAKVNRLVALLEAVLQQSGVGKGKIEHTRSLFKGMMRSTVSRQLATDCTIYAGIGGALETGSDYLSVWFETPAKHPAKSAFKSKIADLLQQLKKRNRLWIAPSQNHDSGWAAWDDVELTLPLAVLLAADDQEAAIKKIVGDALDDLKEAGIIDAFYMTIGKGKKAENTN